MGFSLSIFDNNCRINLNFDLKIYEIVDKFLLFDNLCVNCALSGVETIMVSNHGYFVDFSM